MDQLVTRLTIYSRPGCHLCDEMDAIVRQVIARHGDPDIVLEQIDVSTDPALLARYGLEIPVLLIDGRKAAKYRITERELLRQLGRRSVGPWERENVGTNDREA